MIRQKKITIRQLAEMADVTPTTVSLALRGKGNISTVKREHIRRLAEELNYSPSQAAQALRGSATHAIGVIINFFNNPFFNTLFAGIESEMKPRGYSFWVAQSGDDPVQESVQARQMAARGVDGLIVLPCSQDVRHLEELQQAGKPVVLIGNHVEEKKFAAVVADNLRGGEIAAARLAPGRMPVHIAGPQNQSISILRCRGFLNIVQKNRPAYEAMAHIYRIPRMGHAEGYAAMEALARKYYPPLSIFAVNDETALGVLKFCRCNGLSVPRDIEIIGFGNITLLDMLCSKLSTVNIPTEQMGRKAARLLLQAVEEPERNMSLSVLDVAFVQGETTLNGREIWRALT
ncbi:MAG: LacI family transcriptional regulator [Desulfovibrio sp.]|jgi:LacI family transcriptional regulator|nr:LacI family transcriptional regulator [Desulfovibrio sp.]